MQLGERLGNVDSQTILAAFVSRREQTNQVEVKRIPSQTLSKTVSFYTV